MTVRRLCIILIPVLYFVAATDNSTLIEQECTKLNKTSNLETIRDAGKVTNDCLMSFVNTRMNISVKEPVCNNTEQLNAKFLTLIDDMIICLDTSKTNRSTIRDKLEHLGDSYNDLLQFAFLNRTKDFTASVPCINDSQVHLKECLDASVGHNVSKNLIHFDPDVLIGVVVKGQQCDRAATMRNCTVGVLSKISTCKPPNVEYITSIFDYFYQPCKALVDTTEQTTNNINDDDSGTETSTQQSPPAVEGPTSKASTLPTTLIVLLTALLSLLFISATIYVAKKVQRRRNTPRQ